MSQTLWELAQSLPDGPKGFCDEEGCFHRYSREKRIQMSPRLTVRRWAREKAKEWDGDRWTHGMCITDLGVPEEP